VYKYDSERPIHRKKQRTLIRVCHVIHERQRRRTNDKNQDCFAEIENVVDHHNFFTGSLLLFDLFVLRPISHDTRRRAKHFPRFHSHRSSSMTKSDDSAPPSSRNITLISALMQRAHAPSQTQLPRPRAAGFGGLPGTHHRQAGLSHLDVRALVYAVITQALEEDPYDGEVDVASLCGSTLPSPPSRRPPRDDEGATN
jgi:hypothetical protein